MAGERTEQASPRRRQRARAEGDRPRSRELLAASATLAGSMALGWAAPGWLVRWRAAYQQLLTLAASPAWRAESGVAAALELRAVAMATMMPLTVVLAAGAGAALFSGIAQGGGVSLQTRALAPRWAHVNPLANFGNLFSLRATARLVKTILPVAVLTFLAGQKLLHQAEIPVFSFVRLPVVFADAYSLLTDAAWILFVWSAIDYAVEWRSWAERLKMTRQELRDEYRETEGNPQVRGRIRGLQRQMRARLLRAEVARASVVVTNPDHNAVALSFDFETMEAPQVLAKGRNLLAERIKSEARWAGVPIVENPPLARSLYRSVEPGQAIPFELYAAVAGILAYLYRQQVEERIRQQQRAARATAQTPGGTHRSSNRPAQTQTTSSRTANQNPAPNQAPNPDSISVHPESSNSKSANPGESA
jgi:flagellar biosynthesis protein FlhB